MHFWSCCHNTSGHRMMSGVSWVHRCSTAYMPSTSLVSRHPSCWPAVTWKLLKFCRETPFFWGCGAAGAFYCDDCHGLSETKWLLLYRSHATSNNLISLLFLTLVFCHFGGLESKGLVGWSAVFDIFFIGSRSIGVGFIHFDWQFDLLFM